MSGLSGHERPNRGETDVWLTPPPLLAALGSFDLDPCAATDEPWPTASRRYVEADDGLAQPWEGRVWCNPPYSDVGPWLARLGDHGTGTALIFARTETAVWHRQVWHRQVWPRATGVLFLRGRIKFYRPDGTQAKGAAGAPSALVAFGEYDAEVLAGGVWPGHYVHLRT